MRSRWVYAGVVYAEEVCWECRVLVICMCKLVSADVCIALGLY